MPDAKRRHSTTEKSANANPRSIPTPPLFEQREIPKPLKRLRDHWFRQGWLLVFGYAGIDLLAPGLNTASQVLDLEPGLLQKLRCLLATASHFAMGHNLAATVQFPYALGQVAQRE